MLVSLAVAPHSEDADGEVLLRDDFEGAVLDEAVWNRATWKLGQSRLDPENVVAEDGHAVIRWNAFDPLAPGTQSRGGELYSAESFVPPEDGYLEISARIRLGDDLPPGIVTSLFTYTAVGEGPEQTSDEIDFEFLTNMNESPGPGAAAAITVTTWNDFQASQGNWGNEVTHSTRNKVIADFDLTEFHVYTIRWRLDRVDWLVDGRVIRTATSAVPDEPSPVRLNVWAGHSNWADSFDERAATASSAEDATSGAYYIDWVEVRRFEGKPEGEKAAEVSEN